MSLQIDKNHMDFPLTKYLYYIIINKKEIIKQVLIF